ncbi:MAG: Autophagy protein 22 [Chrysothrix sp. TS-e1954]|nr:MAG: Autophagy protein 22 [Chrysothrix sp. TS-e1954]
MYTFSISVAVQALVIVSMSGAADHGRYRKSLLLAFAFTGATATMLLLLVTSRVYLLGALLVIIANVCFGASFVLLNSYLPLLVRRHPSVESLQLSRALPIATVPHDLSDDEADSDPVNTMSDSTSALLPGHSRTSQTSAKINDTSDTSSELQLSTSISSTGIGIGYLAAFVVQILSVLIVQLSGGGTSSLKFVLFFIGLWWFLFTLPSAVWLRARPGPPLQRTDLGIRLDSQSRLRSTWAYLRYAWHSLYLTCLRARLLQDVLLFLAAWFLLSDGIATISSTAVLFAKTTLHMKPAALAAINVVTMLFGVAGAFFWRVIARFFKLTPAGVILACLAVFELIPLYALIGYLPFIQSWGVLGLQQAWEMYPLAAVYGLVLGGLSSYCRSVFGELVPPGNEAAFFALYAITDKGSSVLGPAVVGAITDATGDIRPAFWFLAVLIGLPFPILWMVDVDRGRHEGAKMAQELQGAAAEDG